MPPFLIKSFGFFIIVFLLITTNCFTQEPPIEFGEVDIRNLQMTEYELDTSAPAVVLCSYGEYEFGDRVFTHTLRLKILKKEGYNLASRKYWGISKTRVKGFTYNLINGEIVKDELTEEMMFVDDSKKSKSYLSVAMPNVNEGSVIDLQIKYYGFPSEWYFQEVIPVVWSELRLDPPQNYRYRKVFFGYEILTVNEENRWVAENVPAFIDEPYMDSRENYVTKFEIDIIEINAYGHTKEISTTWEKLSEKLLEHTYFGDALKTGNYINRKAKDIAETHISDEAKLKASVDFIHEVEFNGRERYYTTNISFSTTYKEKIGNSADINLMLIKLLRKLDFTVYPVILSTKDNGLLSPAFPSKRRLNYVLAYVKLKDDYLLIDATDELLPYYLLPEKCLNWRGRIIDEDSSRWVDLRSEGKDKDIVYYQLNLEKDFTLTGTLSHRRSEYAAYNFRKEQKKFRDREEYLESLLEKYPGIEINNMEVKNLDSIYLPVSDIYDVKINDMVLQMDSLIYLNPVLFEQMDENPFKANERKYPLDFSYPIERSGILNLTIPLDYEIVELPKSEKFVLRDNAASFVYSVKQMGNVIILKYTFRINQTKFILSEYNELKAFYNEVILKEAQPLIIKPH